MTEIYEEEGPRWTDSTGEEQVGWPYDGWRFCLRQLGPDAFELESESRHIDGDGASSEKRRMTRDEARAWLAGRKPVPRHVLARYFDG